MRGRVIGSEPLSGVNVPTGCAMFVCVCVCARLSVCVSVKIRSLCLRVRQNSEFTWKFKGRPIPSGKKSGEKSGCVIPGSFHCLLLGGPHRFLQPLLVARVLRQLVCGTTLQLCSERRNRVPTPTAKKSTSWAWKSGKRGMTKEGVGCKELDR